MQFHAGSESLNADKSPQNDVVGNGGVRTSGGNAHIVGKRSADDVLENQIKESAPHILFTAELEKIITDKSRRQDIVVDGHI